MEMRGSDVSDGTEPPIANRSLVRRGNPQLLVAIYGLAMFVAGLLLLTVAQPLQGTPRYLPFPWWAMVLGFFAAEASALHIEIRRETHTLSLSGIPLLFGLLSLSPITLVLSRLLGNGAALVLVRKRTGLKLAWNLSLYLLETATAAAVASLVLVRGAPDQLVEWIVLLGAVLAAELISLVAVPVVIMIVESELRLSLYAQIARSQFIAVVSSTFAILAAAAMLDQPWLGPLAMVPLVGVAGLLRMHGRLGKEHHDLQQLHHFTTAIAGRNSLDSGLEHLAIILRSSCAAVAVETAPGIFAVRSFRNDTFLDSTVSIDPSLPKPELTTVISAGLPEPSSQALIHELGGQDGIVSLFTDHEGSFVYVLLIDRLGTTDVFSSEEVQLFGSLTATLRARMSTDNLLARLETQARIDALTGLANRSSLETELTNRLSDATSSGAVLLLDLDRFKDVNDSLGHNLGDELLRVFADRLSGQLKPGDLAGRLGGDEFAVILDGSGPDANIELEVASLVDQLNLPLELEGLTLEIGSSLGIARWPADAHTSTELLRLADIAMYEAKRTHQRWVAYEPTIDHANAHRLALMGQLRDAMADHQLEVHLQPQVRTADLGLVGAEALLRWRHPERGMIPPGEFLGLAEQSSLATALTKYVIDDSLRTSATLRAAGIELTISVNLTSRDLLDRTLASTVSAALAEWDVPASSLCLEVTEGSLIVDIETAISHLSALRDLGCRVSVDDFGTGYASLQYLQRLPIDEVKIDRSFIADAVANASSQSIVRSTNRLIQDLGLEVVAEGVEDIETLELLREIGCDLVQGYYVSPPIEVHHFIEWAKAHQPDAQTTPPSMKRIASRLGTEHRHEVPTPQLPRADEPSSTKVDG